jgi:hypothetical protein
MTLNITIDLVVQVLYGIELPKDEFDILVKALAAYIVPGSPNQGTSRQLDILVITKILI